MSTRPSAARPFAARPFADWLGQTNDVTTTFLAAGAIPDLINLAGGLPDPALWPTQALADLAQAAVRDHPQAALGYGPNPGLPRLRDAIAARHGSEAVPLTRDNVLITTGGTQGLSVLGGALLDPQSPSRRGIAVQTPTYLGALDAWRPRAPIYHPMALAEQGYDPRPAMARAQFAYTVPNFSNPTGRLVDLAQRKTLLAAARDTGCWLVEDDPYGTLHYDGAPLPSLLELSGDGTPYDGPVIYLGTASKTLAPGVRVGWVIAAPRVIAALAAAKLGQDMFTCGISQLIAAQALEQGLDLEIAPRMCRVYSARRDALCAALDSHLSEHLTWQRPVGGMFVWARARDPRADTDALMREALSEGVCLSPSSVFDPKGGDRGAMRLNFTLNPEDRLGEGIKRLARALHAHLRAAA